LTPDNANTNSNAGGSVDNGWGWLQIIEALHTSIVEEIIVVAVPARSVRNAGGAGTSASRCSDGLGDPGAPARSFWATEFITLNCFQANIAADHFI
jgi:hypothetical protein